MGSLNPVSWHQAQGARLWGAITPPPPDPPHPAAFSDLSVRPPRPAAHTPGVRGARAGSWEAVLSQEEPGSRPSQEVR